MKTYGLYLESGPKRMKTMVHVLDLLGCVATGPTTDAALESTPESIRAYLRLLSVAGERVAPETEFRTRIVEHITQGIWIGNGTPYLIFQPDLKPVTEREIELFLRRLHTMREISATWAAAHTPKQLERKRIGDRTAKAILIHGMPGVGSYLSPVVGGTKGFSALMTATERGEVALPDAIRRCEEMAAEIVRGTTAEQRRAVIQRPKEVRTLRKALRRMLEHDWEHLYELSRMPGGPSW